MKLGFALSTILLFGLLVTPCLGQQDLYDNGPTNGNEDAWTLNFGYEVSNTFTMPSCDFGCTVNGLVFAAWLLPGDVLESAEVSITSDEFGGTSYFDQAVSFTQSNCVLNNSSYGSYDVCIETGSLGVGNLNPGNYWLNIQNAVVNNGDPVYWDENSGPSQASESAIGTVPSESFTIVGTSNGCWWCYSLPEPGTFISTVIGSITMFGSGVLSVFAVRRRRHF